MSVLSTLISNLKHPKPIPEIQDPGKVEIDYKYWRIRIFYSMYVGYAVYYFTRKSFTFAIPSLAADLNMDVRSLGWLSSMLAISYGISKFISGMISDNANARYFMSIGLIMTGILNIIFASASTFWIFAVCWMLNGWFQGFGWPPCAKFLSFWYSHSERGRWWSAWNTSHNLGGAIIPVLIAFFADHWGWRVAMNAAGAFAILSGLWLINRLRDNPASLGLPPVEKYMKEPITASSSKPKQGDDLTIKEIFFKYILKNKFIWILGLAYFFVYVIRTIVNDWTMLFLMEQRGYKTITDAGKIIFAFEIGGVFGSLFAGWVSDKIFKGGRGPVNFFFAAFLTIFIVLFWQLSYVNIWIDALLIGAIGFFVFGPQMMIGIAAVELSHKRAAATSTGFIGWIAYLGAVVAGGPFTEVLHKYGWNSFFIVLFICSIIITIALSFLYKARTFYDGSKAKAA